jgi:hypothetical protein
MGTSILQALGITKGKKKKGKKGRKIGRYSKHPSSVRYRSERRWERNKVRRLRRHLKAYPDDLQAKGLLSQID